MAAAADDTELATGLVSDTADIGVPPGALGAATAAGASPPAPMDMLSRDELIYMLSNHLNTAPLAIAALSCVCRSLRDAATDDGLWHQLLQASFWDAGLSPLKIPSLRWTPEESDRPERSIRASRALSPRQLFARYFAPVGRNMAGLCPAPAPRLYSCRLCDNSLLRRVGDGRRCPCVATRGAQLPLRLFSLSPTRSRASSLDTLDTFSEMRATLEDLFELTVVTTDRIEAGSLDKMDMVILCTTEGEGLGEDEQAELHRYVHAGGTAIVSAFTNWSARHHYNRALYAWLGVNSNEGADFEQRQVYPLEASAADWLHEHSVWGTATRLAFVNTGETQFEMAGDGRPLHGSEQRTTLAFFPRQVAAADVDEPAVATTLGIDGAASNRSAALSPAPAPASAPQPPRTFALNVRVPPGIVPGTQVHVDTHVGAVAVTVPTGARPGQLLRLRLPVPAGQPAPRLAAAPVGTRRGQVLVLSNLHCFANQHTWHGGHWSQQPGNRALFLDLVSDAIAWRKQEDETEGEGGQLALDDHAV